ncbi:MAG: OmpH family outer membrane protein [Selenomonadales bacterium]|nr:OmpH family outer membrane protein [Selenomonadales bacterium]
MMRLEKIQIKMITLTIVAFFVLSIVGIAMSQNDQLQVAGAAPASGVGVVDMQMLVAQHPDMATAQAELQTAVKEAQKNFEAKAASMNNKEKQDYLAQLEKGLMVKEQSLMEPIMKKIEDAIKAVADKKGLSVVVGKDQVVYGGTDITAEVAKNFVK